MWRNCLVAATVAVLAASVLCGSAAQAAGPCDEQDVDLMGKMSGSSTQVYGSRARIEYRNPDLGVSGVTAAPSSGASDVSSATIEALASDGLVAQASRSRAPRIGLDDAVQRARSEFPGMLGDKSPNVEASAMSVTIAEYGEQLQADPDKASEIRLAVDHRLAWVLIFDNVDVPLMGSFNEGEMDSLPTPLPSRFVVLIDGETGAFLHARTF